MNNVKSLGAIALKYHGAENLTLVQLAQVEEEGLWADETLRCAVVGVVIPFQCQLHSDYSAGLRTQMRHTE